MAEIIGDLEELTGLVRRSARQETLGVEADSRRRAKQVRDQADAKAQHLRGEILAVAQSEAVRERQRLLAQVALETQRRLLTEREALLDQVWVAAEQALRALPGQATYAEVLRRLAMAAGRVLGQGPIVLAADPVGHELLTSGRLAEWSTAAQMQFVCAQQPAPIWGGLLARDVDARRQVDASFATRLELARAELREQVAQRLGIA